MRTLTRVLSALSWVIGDAVYPQARHTTFPCLLADMPAPTILAYPPETVVAEKFEAIVRFGEANGRLKDFNDIWAIADVARLPRAQSARPQPAALRRCPG
jgi:hypothetical protein